MRKTKDFINDFMRDIDNDIYNKEYLVNEGPKLTQKYVDDKVDEFDKMISDGIFSEIMDEH